MGLPRRDGRLAGVDVRTPDGPVQIQADLVVGCDGRHSTIRRAAELEVLEFGVPIDVLWFRISRKPDDPRELFGNINYGQVLVLINRDTYYQAGLIIRKGSFDAVKNGGLNEFRRTVSRIAPYLDDRVHEIEAWDQVKLLTVQLNRLHQWHRAGVLCIGDAAHAMSPAGGVGINLAIQDAVAAANLLAKPLLERRVQDSDLARVQRRRELPTRVTQFMQTNAHRGYNWVFRHPGPIHAPWQLRVAFRIPGIQHAVGRVVGMGIRPEHARPARGPSLGKLAVCAAAVVVGILLLRRR